MKRGHRWLACVLAVGASLIQSTVCFGQANSWTNTTGGKWEAGANWSAGVPTSAQSAHFVTNTVTGGFSKTVVLDAATPAANRTISNLTVSATGLVNNTVLLTNQPASTPLVIRNELRINDRGTVTLTNATLHVEGVLGGALSGNGVFNLLDGGVLISTNAETRIGDIDSGVLTMRGGLWLAENVKVGDSAAGTLTIAGGTNVVRGQLSVSHGGTGTVWVTGGQLVTTNGIVPCIGCAGIGQLTISNGAWVSIGENVGVDSSGTLTIAGGTNTVLLNLNLASTLGSNATVWITGGHLRVNNGTTQIGASGFGELIVTDGTWSAKDVVLALNNGSDGKLRIAGGTSSISSKLVLGHASSTGTVWVTGGELLVTNLNAFTSIGQTGPGQMTISNGTWLARNVGVGSVFGASGTLTVAGGISALIPPLRVGFPDAGTGTVWITGGSLVVTNNPGNVTSGTGFVVDGEATLTAVAVTVSNVSTIVGNRGSGSLTVAGGSLLVNDLIVGNLTGSRGTVTFAGGTNRMTASTSIALGAGSTGTVWITGGFVNPATGFGFTVGTLGSGQLVLSNGTLRASLITIGSSPGSAGTLTVAGGTLDGPAALQIGELFGSTGTVWITGSTVVLTNESFFNTIGNGGVGRMSVSNGLVVASHVIVGQGAGAGTLSVAGGTNSVYSDITLGNFVCTATGVVAVTSGRLDVTNAASNAVLEVRSGTLSLSGGTLAANKIVITNACGHFARTGGTLIYSSATLDPNRDSDGDGLSNGWEQQFGLDALDATGDNGAAGDADGDGLSNADELAAGTIPTIHITNITREGNNIRINWNAWGGNTNRLQVSTGDATGSFDTNNFPFVDIDQQIVIPGVGRAVTNRLEIGAASGTTTSRYYRVRLVL